MKHNPLLLSSRFKRVINRDSILISHILIAGVVFVDVAMNSTMSSMSKLNIYGLATIVVLLGLGRLINFFNINNHPLAYLIAYYVVLIYGLVGYGPIGTTYAYLWLIVLYLTNFFYGFKSTLISLFLLTMSLEAQLFMRARTQLVTKTDILALVVQFTIITAIAIFFIDAEGVSEEDRRLLITSIDKAQLERQRLVSLINSMADGVIATDEKGVIKLFNAGSLNIIDTNQDLQGKHIGNYVNLVDSKNKPVNTLKLIQAQNIIFHSRDYSLKYKDGETISLSLSITPIKLGFRQVAERGYIITLRDITREKSLEEERDEFISVISHELRTPVAITEANISNAMFIADKNLDIDSIKKSLNQAHDQVLFLASMLNDLSTLSRAEKGKLNLDPEAVDPAEIAESLKNDYAEQASAKGLNLNLNVKPGLPKLITSNRLYVHEILQNFLTNSIKYTKEGSVTITVEPNEKGVKFVVSDTGIGISKSDLKKVFEKFFRSEDYRTRESNGTGLGLYITKKLAKILGAEFEIDSKINEGSTFGVIIPDLEPPTKKP